MMTRYLRFLATLGLLALLLSCGGRSKAPNQLPASSFQLSAQTPDSSQLTAESSTTLDEALAELDAMPTPEGVDESLFSDLKSALREALADSVGRGLRAAPEATDGAPAEEEMARLKSRPTQGIKLASSPPTGEANRVDDLEITDLHDGTYTLTWSYKNVGDYDQDGIVNIQDITPLAVHFNETADETNEWIDGNGDTVINIQDITPLAANFGIEVAGYSLLAASTPEGSYGEITTVSLGSATGEARRSLTADIPPDAPRYVRVVPLDTAQVGGIASSILRVLDPPPPNAIWMVPNRSTIEEGETVTVTVYANKLANTLRLLDTVLVGKGSDDITYVEGSWNAGARGGEWSEKDGIWSLFTSELLLCAGSVSGGVWPVSPSNEIPPGGSGALYNFQVEAAAAGTANLYFVRTYHGYDYTFYTDIAGNKYFFDDSQQLAITVLGAHEAAFLDSESVTSGAREARTASASKHASGPPVGPENAVYDLEITDNGDGTYTLSWSYTNVGDFNQDGIVNPADAARVALHWDEPANESNEWIDANGDGIVNLTDYLVMVNNAYAECVGYSVQFGESLEGPFTELTSVPLDLTWEVNVRKRFSVVLPSPDPGFYRVVAYDYSGSMGASSNVVQLVAP